MLDCVREIFSHYVPDVNRFNIHSVEMVRGENLEDLFYLCEIKDSFYIVYETDYMGDLSYAIKEAATKFGDDVTLLHCLTKKDSSLAGKTVTIDKIETKENREAAILDIAGTYWRCVVIEVAIPSAHTQHYHPAAYGYSD